MTDNIYLLQQIQNKFQTSKSLTKRLFNELKNIPSNITFTFEGEVGVENKIIFYTKNNENKNNEICTISIPLNYPFNAPNVFYKGVLFPTIQMSNYEKLQLKQILNIDCLCCHHLFCKNKWAPVYKLIDILKLILQYQQLIKHIYKGILRMIVKQHLGNTNDLFLHILSFI